MNRVSLRVLGLAALVGCAVMVAFALLRAREARRAPTRRDSTSESGIVPSAEPSQGAASRGSLAEVPPRPGLAGTIVVIDEEGHEHSREDGSFRLIFWTDGSGESDLIDVSAGAWRAHLAGPGKVDARDIRLGGRLAYAEEDDIQVPAGGAVPIRARWIRASSLRVLDDATGRDLSDIEIVQYVNRGGWDPGRNVNPAGADVERPLPVGVASPVTLPERVDVRHCWVRAPGYAWRPIRIDHRLGGEHVVRLPLGGTLEVTLVNHMASPWTRLSLWPLVDPGSAPPDDDQPPLLECPIPANGGMTIEGLDAGRYDVRVSLRSWFDHPLVLGWAEASVAAGRVATVTITLADPPATRSVPVRGTLAIPKGWGDWSPYLMIMPARMLVADPDTDEQGGVVEPRVTIFPHQMTRDEAGLLHWDAGEIPPGDYVATLGDIGLAVRVRVGASGEAAVRIDVPEPVQLRVQTIDRRTGRIAPIRKLDWHPSWTDGITGGSLETVEALPGEPGTFSFRVPTGKIEIEPSDEAWTTEPGEREVRERSEEIKLEVSRRSGIRVTFKDGSATVPSADNVLAVKDLDGDGEAECWTGDGTSRSVYVSAPGRYELTLRAPEGYEPIPARAVTVGEGELAVVGD